MKTTLIIALLLVCTLASIGYARHYYTVSVYSRGAYQVPISISTGEYVITDARIYVYKNQSITLEAPEFWDDRVFRSWSGSITSNERKITLDKVRSRQGLNAIYVRLTR